MELKIQHKQSDSAPRTNPDTVKNRLQFAQWILERNLALIASNEVTARFVIAIDIVMLGGLGAVFNSSGMAAITPWEIAAAGCAAVSLIISMFLAVLAVLPGVTGPAKSFVYFRGIARQSEAEYLNNLKTETDEYLLNDLSAQIHHNARIAASKVSRARAGALCSFFAVFIWIGAIILLLCR